jgi:hypothetical protein
MNTGQQVMQGPYQTVQKSPIRAQNDGNYPQQMQGSPPMVKQSIYPFAGAGTSNVESNQSFEQMGEGNDLNHYRNQEYKQRYR